MLKFPVSCFKCFPAQLVNYELKLTVNVKLDECLIINDSEKEMLIKMSHEQGITLLEVSVPLVWNV